MSVTSCSECNKVISTRFPMHECTPFAEALRRARRAYDRLVKATAGNHNDPGIKARLAEAEDDIKQLEKLNNS